MDKRPDRGRERNSAESRGPEGGRRTYQKKKVCRFCKNPGITIDYKDAKALRPYITEKGRIMPRRISGTCAKHQRVISSAIKRARHLAIIPFTATSL